MSAKGSKFLIGIFVIVGFLICVGTIIWIGAARVLMKGSLYAVYFDESVQGLQVDSAIKYRGVDIGKVQRIDVAEDFRLIEVIMKIDLEGDLGKQTIASLKTAGITGIVFIELDRIREGELKGTPQLQFQIRLSGDSVTAIGHQPDSLRHRHHYAKCPRHRFQGDFRSDQKHVPGH